MKGKFPFKVSPIMLLVSSTSLLVVFLLGLFLIPILSPNSTYADEILPGLEDPSISIVPASNITLPLTPAIGESGTLGTAIAMITISTTNATGYTFTMNTETTNTDLLNSRIDYSQAGAANYKITSVTTSTTVANFTPNKWGYNVNKAGTYIKGAANTFIPIPNGSSSDADKEIEVTDTTGSNTYSFSYGVKVNNNLPAGDYTNTIVYSATANPLPTMQDFDYDTCQSLTTEQAITLYDERDNKSYKVAKLADDNCWMLDNLALDLVASKNNITSSNTNASDTYLNYLKGVNTGTTSDQYPTAGVSYWTSSYSFSAPLIAIKNASNENWNPDTVASVTYGNGSGKIGVYYNYCAASAGSYCWGNGTSYTGSPESNPKSDTLYDIDADICPAGWHMPTTTSGGEYYYLYNTAYAANATNFKTALSTPLSGNFDSGSADYQGSYGSFWSSTWGRTYDMRSLSVDASYVYPSDYYDRSYGTSLRCVKDTPPTLYETVASMSKGTQTLTQLRTAIDASNSGVYEYNSSVFGTSSDAANTSKIYYYRGILDNTVGSYGSDGDNAAWPNTVVLSTASSKSGLTTSDTCWRIVRTTGSGGIKMIYQGKWTGSTCANSSTNANAVSSVYFNRRSSSTTNSYDTKGRIIYVGYNYSNTSSHQTGTSSVANSTLFVNGTASNLRTQLESWYNSNMTSYTSKLETSAGWCNDRTTYSGTTTSTKTTSNVPYLTSSATVNFGAYIRNTTTNSQPTLGCPNDTGYDLLTTANGYISVPSAPLTADEAALAGSGYSSSTTPYHANSFLRSGVYFWLLSPSNRTSSGGVYEFYLHSDGDLGSDRYVSNAYGVRPSISLTSGTVAVSGTGTATDPWIVNP